MPGLSSVFDETVVDRINNGIDTSHKTVKKELK